MADPSKIERAEKTLGRSVRSFIEDHLDLTWGGIATQLTQASGELFTASEAHDHYIESSAS